MEASTLYVESQIEGLEKLGFDRLESLRVLDMTESDLDDPRLRVSVDRLVDLFDAAESKLKRDSIGIEVGSSFRVATFSQTGRIYAFCRDLAEVVRMNGRYQRIAIDAGEATLVEDGDRAFLHFDTRMDCPQRYRHVTDIIFGGYGTAFQWLNWGSGRGNKGVYLRRTAPADSSPYVQAFGCPVHFESEHDRLEFYPETLRKPLPTADPEKLGVLQERLDGLLAVLGGDDSSLVRSARAAIRRCLRNGRSDIASVAEDLQRSERQLRKALKDRGLGYRGLLDSVRQDLYLHERARGRTYHQIAEHLGYNDQAAFNRAFKRWYGRSPTEHEQSRNPSGAS